MLHDCRNGFGLMPDEPSEFISSDSHALTHDWVAVLADLNGAWNKVTCQKSAETRDDSGHESTST